MGIIYKHTNKINGKSYIGFTKKSIEERLNEHLQDSKLGSERIFHRAIRKYGIENFESEILEILNDIDRKILGDREKYWIKYYKSNLRNIGYNMTEGGDGGNTGGMKEETKVLKYKIGLDGLNDFQRQSKKGWKSRKYYNKNIIEITDYDKRTCKNARELELHRLKMAIIARNQHKIESQKTKDKRNKRVSEVCSKTVSAYNLETKENKRVSYNEWNYNPLLGGMTNYITKVTFKEKEYYLFNPNSYIKFGKEFGCSKDWVKGLSSNGIPFKTPYKKFKHLEGIIRERILIKNLTEMDIKKIKLNNYI